MNLKADYKQQVFNFKQAGGTSRGILHQKPSWYIRVWDDENPTISGVGECSVIPGLSPDDKPDLDNRIKRMCHNINEEVVNYHEKLKDWPAIRFALEVALTDLQNGGKRILYPSDFTSGKDLIEINGLIWMGDKAEMLQRIQEKLNAGFKCLKLKIGAIDFNQELSLLRYIRSTFSEKELELRVDANGAFSCDEALVKLDQLAQYSLHSIEQPIQARQWKAMADLCKATPLPIALDEELIGVNDVVMKEEMLDVIKPQYIILKPSLVGGFQASDEWISLCEQRNISWWATSALEGNIGLNAIAQWAYVKKNELPQGLGTGQVFTNNIESPLFLEKDRLQYSPQGKWGKIF